MTEPSAAPRCEVVLYETGDAELRLEVRLEATRTLREHLARRFTLNERRLREDLLVRLSINRLVDPVSHA